jgi:exopolysaccharide biosynthesis polyprenyl glycosylphosphotransferase
MDKVRSHVRAQITWLAVMDLVSLLAGSVIGVMMRLGHDELKTYVFNHIDGWVLLYSCVILANYLAGSYRLQYTFSRFNVMVTWLFSLAFAVFILSLTSFAWLNFMLGRGVLVLSLAFYSILSLVLKVLVYRSLFRREAFQCRTVIFGTGDRARECRRILENKFVLPSHKVVAFLRIDGGPAPEAGGVFLEGIVVVDARDGRVGDIARSLGANLIVAEMNDREGRTARYYSELKRLRFEGIEVLTPLTVAEIYSGATPVDLINDEILMQASMESNLPLIRRVKRIIDVILASVGIALSAPLALLIAFAIKISAPGSPVLYSQVRSGQFGIPFRIFKFRTMVPGAERETGPVWSLSGDPRVTRIGRFLRRFRLDEVPQLFNVVRGEMAIVGPRPERPEIVARMTKEIPFYEERCNAVPGLTGWAQVQYPYGSTVDDARRKLEYDLFYVKHLSLSLDLQIVLRTLRIVLLGKERAI